MKQYQYIIIFILFITSVGFVQKQKRFDDIKQIAKFHFEKQFEMHKNSRNGKSDDFIYFDVNQNDRLIYFLNDGKRINKLIKDTLVIDKLFNNKELENYKTQIVHQDIEKYKKICNQ